MFLKKYSETSVYQVPAYNGGRMLCGGVWGLRSEILNLKKPSKPDLRKRALFFPSATIENAGLCCTKITPANDYLSELPRLLDIYLLVTKGLPNLIDLLISVLYSIINAAPSLRNVAVVRPCSLSALEALA